MRSTFRILFYLKRSAKLRSGSVPILCRITICGEREQLPTRLHILPRNWNRTRGCARGRGEEATTINQSLSRIRYVIEKSYHSLSYDHEVVTAAMVKRQYCGRNARQEQLLAFFSRYNEEFLQMVGVTRSRNTYYKYRCVFRLLARYVDETYGKSDLSFFEIDRKFVAGFHAYILERGGRTKGTAWIYMIALKHILSQARNRGCLDGDPFANYKLHAETVSRSYLTLDEIRRLSRLSISSETRRIIRDAFLFSCFTGLAYIDIKQLRSDQIHASGDAYWLSIRRQKTDTAVDVRLFDLPRSIFRSYSDRYAEHPFPLPSNGWCNSCLKELAVQAGICKPVTFHTARHTFATTITLSQGVAIETISKLLGHRNIKTTQIYADLTHARLCGEMQRLDKRLNGLCRDWN